MKTVVVSGGDLFHLALTHLGDATQWNRLAQANNLLDPLITGITTITIPSLNPQATGGVLVL